MNFRYQKQLIDIEILKKTASRLAPCFQYWWQKYQHKEILDCEFAAIYLLYYQWIRCPENPFMGYNHSPIVPINELPSQSTFQDLKMNVRLKEVYEIGCEFYPFQLIPKQVAQWPMDLPLLIFINQLELRGIPRAGLQGVVKWYTREYPLVLFAHVPSAYEVLKMQSDGIRCVTAFLQEAELAELYLHTRDPMSFLLHDLIHAHHFMSNPQQFSQQIAFSKLLLKTYNTEQLQFYLNSDSIFNKEFDYLSSDMNGHPCHLYLTLRSIMWMAWDRNPYPNTNSFAEMWEQYLKYWEFNDELCFLNSVDKNIFRSQETCEKFVSFLTDPKDDPQHSFI